MSKVVGIKLTDSDHARWAQQAKSEGLTLTEWVRATCNTRLDYVSLKTAIVLAEGLTSKETENERRDRKIRELEAIECKGKGTLCQCAAHKKWRNS